MTNRNPVQWLARTARRSPWVVMSVLAHVIVIAGFSVLYIQRHAKHVDEVTTVIRFTPPRDPNVTIFEEPVVPDRHVIPPLTNVDTEIVDTDVYVLPDAVAQDVDLTKDIGDPYSTLDSLSDMVKAGGAIGVGGASTPGGGVTPNSNRTGKGTSINLPPGRSPEGIPVKTEKAVLEGLRWLARHQNPNGSWSPASLHERCKSTPPCYDTKEKFTNNYDTGATALALLCFLGHGLGHASRAHIVDPVEGRDHVAGEIVKNGLQWLVKRQGADGSFSSERPFMYNEALATLALAEAYGLTRNPYWKKPAQRAVDFLQAAQRPNPNGHGLWGWRYRSRVEVEDFRRGGSQDEAYKKELFDSDTSVTGWAVMALKSAQLAGLAVDPESFAGAIEFCRFVTPADGSGQVGYLDFNGAGASLAGRNDHFIYHPTSMSALGMCIRIFTQHDPNDPFLEQAAKYIVQDLPAVSKDGLSVDYYYWYYGSLALNQFDGPESPRKSGKYWSVWNKAMIEALTGLQDAGAQSCARGGWIRTDRWSYDAGPIYTTALNVLTLEVYYRYENAFGGTRLDKPRAPVAEPATQELPTKDFMRLAAR